MWVLSYSTTLLGRLFHLFQISSSLLIFVIIFIVSRAKWEKNCIHSLWGMWWKRKQSSKRIIANESKFVLNICQCNDSRSHWNCACFRVTTSTLAYIVHCSERSCVNWISRAWLRLASHSPRLFYYRFICMPLFCSVLRAWKPWRLSHILLAQMIWMISGGASAKNKFCVFSRPLTTDERVRNIGLTDQLVESFLKFIYLKRSQFKWTPLNILWFAHRTLCVTECDHTSTHIPIDVWVANSLCHYTFCLCFSAWSCIFLYLFVSKLRIRCAKELNEPLRFAHAWTCTHMRLVSMAHTHSRLRYDAKSSKEKKLGSERETDTSYT